MATQKEDTCQVLLPRLSPLQQCKSGDKEMVIAWYGRGEFTDEHTRLRTLHVPADIYNNLRRDRGIDTQSSAGYTICRHVSGRTFQQSGIFRIFSGSQESRARHSA